MKTCLVNLYDLDPPRNGGMSRFALLASRLLAEYDEAGRVKVFFAVGWRYSAQFREWLGHSGGTLIPVLSDGDQTPLLNSLKPDISINPLFGMFPVANRSGYTGVVNVSSMPDALALDKPHLFSEAELKYRRAIYDQLKQANLVVTISDHARSRLIHHLDLKEEQITVIPLAGDDLHPGVAAAPFFGSLGENSPSSPYVFYPANGWPHKRHDLLLRAMKHIWKNSPNVSLVLTGWHSPGYVAELAARHECPMDKIIDLGYVNAEAMISLYRNAEALVFVSEYEGFCMPVLEAMKNDCPVICAPVASLPEVAGNAALYVESSDPADWADAFLGQLPNRRAELIEKGRIKAGEYSWERTKQEWANTLLQLGFGQIPGQKDFLQLTTSISESVVSSEIQVWAEQYSTSRQGLEEKQQVIQEQAQVIQEQMRALQEKEGVIQEQMRALQEKEGVIQSFQRSLFFWLIYGPFGRFIPFRKQIARLGIRVRFQSMVGNIRAHFLPKLGVLIQYPPRPLQISARYQKEPRLPEEQLPVISMVTPSYNQAVFLERTIQSVFSQDYPRMEYVIQDGKSTDGSDAVIEKHRTKLTYAESVKDDGQANAINLGFRHTLGEVMAYLNSDDMLLPGTLHYVAGYFARHPDVDVVYGHRVIVDENDDEVGIWVVPPHDKKALKWGDYVPQETMFWRRELWEKCGGKVDESFHFALDWDLLLRFQQAGAKIVRLPRFLSAFRVHGAQKSTAQINDLGLREMNLLRERVHGRQVSQAEINDNLRPYLRRSVIYHKLYRLGLLYY